MNRVVTRATAGECRHKRRAESTMRSSEVDREAVNEVPGRGAEPDRLARQIRPRKTAGETPNDPGSDRPFHPQVRDNAQRAEPGRISPLSCDSSATGNLAKRPFKGRESRPDRFSQTRCSPVRMLDHLRGVFGGRSKHPFAQYFCMFSAFIGALV